MTTEEPTDRASSSPVSPQNVPLLGMLIDRTSFDETDDFCIDQQALEASTSVWALLSDPESGDTDDNTIGSMMQQAPSAVIMRNGKVRRRLRWRPRNMMKRRKNPDSTASVVSGMTVNSIGNASLSSRHSKKSVHSFASTETMVKSNTRRSKTTNPLFGGRSRGEPLPRPNYPDHFSSQNHGVSTIGTEGGMIQARMGNQVTPSESNVATQNKTLTAKPTTLRSPAAATTPPKPVTPATAKKKPGMPPLFQQRRQVMPEGKLRRGGASNKSILNAAKKSVATSPKQAVQQRREDETGGSVTPSTTASFSSADTSAAMTDDGDAAIAVLPVLQEEDPDRQVDLRILKSGDREGHASPEEIETVVSVGAPEKVVMSARDSKKKSIQRGPKQEQQRERRQQQQQGVGPLCVDELRMPQKRDDDNDRAAIVAGEDSRRTQSSRGGTATQEDQPFVELEDFTDDEASLLSVEKSVGSVDDINVVATAVSLPVAPTTTVAPPTELRFSMSGTSGKSTDTNHSRPNSPTDASESSKARTGPVDLDDGHFLEVEKNLKAILDVAIEHLQQGEYTEALEVFQEILRGQLARYGETHFRVATAHHNLGIVHTKRGDFSRAVSSYKKAIRIRRKTLEKDHPDIAVSLAQLGVAYLECKKNKKAITAFREALKIRRACYGNSHHKVAKILNNIGCALYELNELEVARVAFEEALAIQRDLLKGVNAENLASSENQLLSIASTQSNIASIKLYDGKFDEALVDLEEALLVQQCVLSEVHPIVKRTEESIAWVEKMRNSSCGMHGLMRGSRNSLFDYFVNVEQRLMAFHSSFDINCGGDIADGDSAPRNDATPHVHSF